MQYTQRIFWTQYNTPEKLTRLLAFLDQHRDICDRISFFTEGDGMDFRYVPLEQIRQRARFMCQVVEQTRDAGFVPEINILNTLGHSDENANGFPPVPWQGIVDDRGHQASQCSCPFDIDFKDYIYTKYQAYAQCSAERYWIDDDFRLSSHNPARWGCFCQSCMDDFAHRTHRSWVDRQSLVGALLDELPLRKAWIARNRDVMSRLLDRCVAGLRSIETKDHAAVSVGMMTCDPIHLQDSCDSLQTWMRQMSGKPDVQPWLRPGGGYWTDQQPCEILTKLHGVSNAIDASGPNVGTTYEVENYPYAIGEKASHSTGLECLLAIISSKLDGLMFNVLDASNDPKHHASWVARLKQWRPLWEKTSQLVQDTLPVGWMPAYGQNHFEHVPADPTNNLSTMACPAYQSPLALQRAGLPMTGFEQAAAGHLLCGPAALGMSQKELEVLLDKPLILDGQAAQQYLRAGLGDRIGITEIQPHTAGVFEQFTDDPISEVNANYRRAATLAYFGLTSYALTPQTQTRVLSKLCTTHLEKKLGAAMTLYEQGPAPIAVLGHMPWNMVLSQPRITQLRQLSMQMLDTYRGTSKNGLPVVNGGESVVFWFRCHPKTSRSIAIFFNAGFDPAALTLKIKIGDTDQTLPNMSHGDVQCSINDQGIHLQLGAWAVTAVDLGTTFAKFM